jgi:hypothetical protein
LAAALSCVALLAVLLPAAGSDPALAAAPTEPAHETIFLLDRPLPLDRVTADLAASGLQPVSFEHTGSSRGGFDVGGLSLDDAARDYRRAFEKAGGTEAQPQVFSVRVSGDVSAESLGELDGLVAATRTVDSGQPAVVIPVDPQTRHGKAPGTTSDRRAGTTLNLRRGTTLDRTKITSALNLRPAVGSEWAPTAGTVSGYEDSPWRVVRHTMWWTNQSQLDSFGETGAYEHNFKLYDYDNTESGLRPGCDSEDFWVQRSLAMYWSTTYPDAAGAYLDTDRDDPCSEADLSIGVYRPQMLSAGVQYTTYFVGLGGPTAQTSPFGLGAQRAPRNCDLPFIHIGVNNPNCVGAVSSPISGYVSLIPDFPGRCSVPIAAKEWTSGSEGSCVVQTNSLVSRGFAGTQGDSSSYVAFQSEEAISDDGRYIVFESHASNLVENDTNGHFDVFVRDTVTDSIERVSVSSEGAQSNSQSAFASISSDGRFVTFASHATNLSPADTGYASDVYVHDRSTGETTLASVGDRGVVGNKLSADPSISDDGRYVVFASEATNLVSRTTTSGANIFLRDTVRGRTTLIAPTWSYDSSISGDGRYVVFTTPVNLVAADKNNLQDVYRYEIATGTFAPVSVSSEGAFANWDSEDPAISEDGRYVVFQSYASNLAPGISVTWRTWTNIYIKDMVTGATKMVSVDSAGGVSNSNSFTPDVSDDGRYVVFQSDAHNLVPGDVQGTWDVFVHDMYDGVTIKVTQSLGSDRRQWGMHPSISGNGSWITFTGQGLTLLPEDTNGGAPDVFVVPRP